uniref:Small auxin-up RNA n=2 Tax=Opuntia streptacantha TaxID=393608 RepID=A0A7C9E3B4_OPUST
MEELKLEKRKNKGILRKTWERCKSFGNLQTKIKVPRSPTSPSPSPTAMVKSKSWSSLFPPSPTPHTPPADKRFGSKNQMGPCVPHGCFSVCVGPNKQRFVIKVECTKHPLFKMLLEEAELEYGFHCDGPLVLPCDVDCFIKVLLEMDGDDDTSHCQVGCRFHRSRSSYNLLSPPRLVALNQL